jgi:GntR family transcriptional regulator, transcriptional repressor for pyruvate dehydrogenase complex
VTARAKVSEVLADRLRSEIANGRYRSGQFLPPEAVLMERYGVGRPSMREALRLVEADGLIRVLRGANGGVEVRDVDPDALAKRLGLYLQMKGTDFADIHRARDFIDPGAVILAAERRDPAALEAMRSCIARMATCQSGEALGEIGADFVRALLVASGNQTLALFALMIDRLLRQELHRFTDAVKDWDDRKASWYANAWTEVVDLIELGDGQAAAAAWAAHRSEVDPTRKSALATESLVVYHETAAM